MNYSEKVSYLLNTHSHIYENIKLADQKALVLIALNPTVLSALYGSKVVNLRQGSLISLFSVMAFCGLIASLVLAILVVYPRGEKITDDLAGGSLASPSKIARVHHTCAQYINEINTSDDSQFIEDLATLVYARSQTNIIKYQYLKQSILVSSIGWFFSFILLFIAIM